MARPIFPQLDRLSGYGENRRYGDGGPGKYRRPDPRRAPVDRLLRDDQYLDEEHADEDE